MRPLLLGILLLLSQLAVAQSSKLQRKVQLSGPQLTVAQTFAELEAQAKLVFAYSGDVPLSQMLTFNQTKGRVRDFLNVFAKETPFTYRLSGDKILIFRPGESAPTAATPTDPDAKYTLSGYLRDADSDEELLYGRVAILETGTGVVSNEYGYFALTLPAGEYHIRFSYLGYAPQVLTITLDQDVQKNIRLATQAVTIKTVEIDETPQTERLHEGEAGKADMAVSDLKTIPVVLGEGDILKSLQLMPGISGANEGGSGLYVRGGSTDQNLLLLDEAPVHNPAHLLGFFSVFNSDALKDIRIYKGGIPSRYGGRASSVFDIRMKEGNRKKIAGSGGIGLIASRFALEGPIFKKKGTFLVTARRSYLDFILRQSRRANVNQTILYFYDLNLKFSYQFNNRDRLYISTYGGRDRLEAANLPVGLDWGNSTTTIRWNHLFSDKLFSNASIVVSDYDYQLQLTEDSTRFHVKAGINNLNIKEDLSWFPSARLVIRGGVNLLGQIFRPGEFSIVSPVDTTRFFVGQKRSLESSLYVNAEQKIGKRVELDYGLRGTLFGLAGPATTYTYDAQGIPVDTTEHLEGGSYHSYAGLAPRISARWRLGENTSIKAAYARLFQYIHKLSNASANLPTDFWAPVSPIVQPQRTDQLSLGYFRNFPQQQLEVSVEAFYKDMANQIDYKDGASLFFNEHFESQLVFGRGRAYGLEFLLRKRKGRLAGWIAYTLSRTERKFAQINFGQWFPARQDRTHDISLVLNYHLSEKLQANLNWVYYTGDAVTFPSGKYVVDGNVVNYYTERNGYRFPDYHRLDLGLTWKTDTEGPFTQDVNFSVYNVYARKNAFSFAFQDIPNQPGQTQVIKFSLFSIVPSITWNFKF